MLRGGRWVPLDGEVSPRLATLLREWQSLGARWDEDAGDWDVGDDEEVREAA